MENEILILEIPAFEEKNPIISKIILKNKPSLLLPLPNDEILVIISEIIINKTTQTLEFHNITNKSSPTLISAISLNSSNIIELKYINHSDKYIVLLDRNLGIFFVNISNYNQPHLLKQNNDFFISDTIKMELILNDNILVVIGPGTEALSVFNITNMKNPIKLTTIKPNIGTIKTISPFKDNKILIVGCSDVYNAQIYIYDFESNIIDPQREVFIIKNLQCGLTDIQNLIPTKDNSLVFYTYSKNLIIFNSSNTQDNTSFSAIEVSKILMVGGNFAIFENKMESSIKMVSFFEINQDADDIAYNLIAASINNITDIYEGIFENIPYRGFMSLLTINEGRNLIASSYYNCDMQSFLPSIVFTFDGGNKMKLKLYTPLQGNLSCVNYGFADKKGRYFFLFGFSWDIESYSLVVYDNNLNTFDQLGKIGLPSISNYSELSVNIFQFDDFLYLMPFVKNGDLGEYQYLMALNISDPKHITINNTNIKSDSQGKNPIASCIKASGEKYIYFKYWSNPYLYIAQASETSYLHFENISKVFIGYKINAIETSDDCNFLYIGGFSFLIINLTNISSPFIVSNIQIKEIYTMNRHRNKIYLHCDSRFYVLSIINPLFPNILYDYMYPLSETKKNEVFLSAIIPEAKYNFIYVGSNKLDENQGREITVFQEKKSYFYLHINKDQPLFVGVESSFTYYCIYLKTFLEIKGVINNIYLINSTNYSVKENLPSWIKISNNNRIKITPPKIYEHHSLALVFVMKAKSIYTSENDVFEQTILFPLAQSSLYLFIDENQKITIETPVNDSIQIIITIEEEKSNFMILESKFKFIDDHLTGIFATFSEIDRSFTASGVKTAINKLLKTLRYTISETQQLTSFATIKVEDYVNDPLFHNLSLANFQRNTPPQCQMSIYSDLSSQINLKNIKLIPLLKFDYQYDKSTCWDMENDPLVYSISNLNSSFLPNWLFFDQSNVRLFGTPSIEDEGEVFLELTISDGYDEIYQIFNFTIYDHAPELKIPLTSQIENKTLFIGEYFQFSLDEGTFEDVDGPLAIDYTFFIQTKHRKFNINSQSVDYWLNFNKQSLTISGTPTITEIINDEQSFTVIVRAFDEVKYCEDNITLNIIPSLNLEKSLLGVEIPKLSTLNTNIKVLLILTIKTGKIIIPESSYSIYNSDVIYVANANKSEINILSSAKIINDLLPEVFFQSPYTNLRDLQDTIKNDSIDDFYVLAKITDELQQEINFSIPLSLLNNCSDGPLIDRSFISNSYLAEVGTSFRILIDKRIIEFPYKSIISNYSFTLYNSNGEKLNILNFDSNVNTFELYSGRAIEESLIGEYNAVIVISDEFQNEYTFNFIIIVDYSYAQKLENIAQFISSIVGPAISILTIGKFFYLIYNYYWRKRLAEKIFYLKNQSNFKLKIPLIKEEFELAENIFNKLQKNLKRNGIKNYFKRFLTLESISFNGSLTSLHEFKTKLQIIAKYSDLKGKKKEIVDCFIEGLLIKLLLEQYSPGLKFLPIFSKEAKSFDGLNINDDWYNIFFFEQLHIIPNGSRASLNVDFNFSNLVQDIGLFRVIQKRSVFLEDFYDKIFLRSMIILKKKRKMSQNDEIILRKLIIRVILSMKIGVPFNLVLSSMVNRGLEKIGMRILPYKYGDSVHISHEKIKKISTYIKYDDEEENNNKKNDKKSFTKKMADCFNCSKKKQQYFSINNKSIPKWLKVQQKKNFLIFSGNPWKDENNKKYFVVLTDSKGYIMLQFWLYIMQSLNQENDCLKPLSAIRSRSTIISNPKITVINTENSLSPMNFHNFNEYKKEKDQIKKKSILISSLGEINENIEMEDLAKIKTSRKKTDDQKDLIIQKPKDSHFNLSKK